MDLHRFSIDLRDNIPIDPVGMKVSLVLGHLPALGRVSKPIVRNSISKRGKFIDLRSKLRSFSAFSRSFNRSKIGFMFTPVFCNASRNSNK